MSLGDLASDRKPEARAVGRRSVEANARFEDPFQLVGRNTRTTIGDLDFELRIGADDNRDLYGPDVDARDAVTDPEVKVPGAAQTFMSALERRK